MSIITTKLNHQRIGCNDCGDTATYMVEGIGGKSGYTYFCDDCLRALIHDMRLEEQVCRKLKNNFMG
jgi:hypothetical protein